MAADRDVGEETPAGLIVGEFDGDGLRGHDEGGRDGWLGMVA